MFDRIKSLLTRSTFKRNENRRDFARARGGTLHKKQQRQHSFLLFIILSIHCEVNPVKMFEIVYLFKGRIDWKFIAFEK